MAKTDPRLFPELVGDAAMIPYFGQLQSIRANKDAPAIPAIYFVYASPDIVLYIGKAIRLDQRWKSHWFIRAACDEVRDLRLAWLPAEVATLDVLERYYIQKLRPPMNKNHARSNKNCVNPARFVEERNTLLGRQI